MRLVVKSTAIFFLALWLPLTLHCRLESLPLFKFLASCCEAGAQPVETSPCEDDACSVVESGFYKTEDRPMLAAPDTATLASVLWPPSEEEATFRAPRAIASVSPPPELAKRWQFLLRTAPAVRAPSLLS